MNLQKPWLRVGLWSVCGAFSVGSLFIAGCVQGPRDGLSRFWNRKDKTTALEESFAHQEPKSKKAKASKNAEPAKSSVASRTDELAAKLRAKDRAASNQTDEFGRVTRGAGSHALVGYEDDAAQFKPKGQIAAPYVQKRTPLPGASSRNHDAEIARSDKPKAKELTRAFKPKRDALDSDIDNVWPVETKPAPAKQELFAGSIDQQLDEMRSDLGAPEKRTRRQVVVQTSGTSRPKIAQSADDELASSELLDQPIIPKKPTAVSETAKSPVRRRTSDLGYNKTTTKTVASQPAKPKASSAKVEAAKDPFAEAIVEEIPADDQWWAPTAKPTVKTESAKTAKAAAAKSQRSESTAADAAHTNSKETAVADSAESTGAPASRGKVISLSSSRRPNKPESTHRRNSANVAAAAADNTIRIESKGKTADEAPASERSRGVVSDSMIVDSHLVRRRTRARHPSSLETEPTPQADKAMLVSVGQGNRREAWSAPTSRQNSLMTADVKGGTATKFEVDNGAESAAKLRMQSGATIHAVHPTAVPNRLPASTSGGSTEAVAPAPPATEEAKSEWEVGLAVGLALGLLAGVGVFLFGRRLNEDAQQTI